jgi:thiol:disulfide interchange protein DsbC
MNGYKNIIIALILVLLPLSSFAFPIKKGGKDCMDCHKLKMEDAEKIIEKAVPGGKIVGIKASPIKGVWEIDVQRGEQRGAVLLDFSKKFLIGQIIPVDQLGKQPPARKVDFSKISLADAVVVGSVDAKKKVIVFTDPDCPYCRELHPVMKAIVEKHHDVAFYLIMNPLPMHKDSYKKAQAILCSKSLTMLDDAFTGKPVPEPSCSADAVERTTGLAKSLEFNGTPTLVREDGTVLSGSLPEEKLLEWIDKK